MENVKEKYFYLCMNGICANRESIGSEEINIDILYKTCPKCGRTILKNRSLCDCGYDFILKCAPNFGSKSRKTLQKEINEEFKRLDINTDQNNFGWKICPVCGKRNHPHFKRCYACQFDFENDELPKTIEFN